MADGSNATNSQSIWGLAEFLVKFLDQVGAVDALPGSAGGVIGGEAGEALVHLIDGPRVADANVDRQSAQKVAQSGREAERLLEDA